MRIRGKTIKQIYNSMLFVMFRNNGFMLVAFALMVSVFFARFYSNAAMQASIDQLQDRAVAIATRVSEFVQDDDYITYPSYLEVLEEIETSDVWIMPNPSNPMNSRYANIELVEGEMVELEATLKAVYSGSVAYEIEYSDTYEANIIFVGAPIQDLEGNVVGAVLVNSLAETQREILQQSSRLMFVSVALALVISFIIAFWLARRLTRPISQMRRTAQELANENYEIHTGLTERGELGELAESIDVLADRLKETEEARRDMEHMRQDFFANVSHELRTPITVIRAYTETLVDGIVTDEAKVHQYYDRMLNECKSMERLVGDLLVLSKMQNPDFQVDKEPINLMQIFDDILRGANTIAAKKRIWIRMIHEGVERTDDGELLCLMLGDYDRIRQMFMVILDNAIKFSEEDSNVEICVSVKDGQIQVSIADHGIGIASEELPHIFDKFYKSKLRQNAKGSGLGLAIARQIAIKHDGTIRVESEVGKGTCFYFSFRQIDETEW